MEDGSKVRDWSHWEVVEFLIHSFLKYSLNAGQCWALYYVLRYANGKNRQMSLKEKDHENEHKQIHCEVC